MENNNFIEALQTIVGKNHVLTKPVDTERYRSGYRTGYGEAIAVVRPGSLLEQWKVLQICVQADKIVIMQAANTGLTEGSTPNGTYDRDVVLINTNRMDQIILLDEGKQVISFPGATLFELETKLESFGRQPHSVIGSSCIGASIVGGVCNNSGGSLIERGPSYTELSIFAKIDEGGKLVLVNHLGIFLGNSPEEILSRLEKGDFEENDFEATNQLASDTDYIKRVRDIEADSPARFNADKRRLYEASGCAGKLAIFAVRLDSYPINKFEQIFYIGTNNHKDLTGIRRHILSTFRTLPVSAEYMHGDIFDLTEKFGKDTVILIDKLGTKYLPKIFAIRGAVEARLKRISFLPTNLVDHCLQFFSMLWPNILPARIKEWRKNFEHHLILKMHGNGIEEARSYLTEYFSNKSGDFFECTAREDKIASLHRFAAAGAAIRYQALYANEVEDILALDIALKRNDLEWLEKLPPEIEDKLLHKLYYGHFLCHVLHQDYIIKKGCNPDALKAEMLRILDKRGAEYPAEHNVGHLYEAKSELAAFYKSIDPTNSLNPGIGKMTKSKNYSGKFF